MIALSTRSHYSFMRGTGHVKTLCARAKSLGYRAIALTDTDNLCALWPFIKACSRNDLVPVIGVEITDPSTPHRAVCLVKNRSGYKNLCRLISKRKLDSDFSLKKNLPGFSDGLVVLVKHHDLLEFWHENNVDLVLNLARTPISSTHVLSRTARQRNIPMAATPDSFFIHPEDAKSHMMLRAIEKNTSLSRLDPSELASGSAFLAAPELYEKKFAAFPEAIANTHAIFEKLTFKSPDFGIVMPPLKEKGRLPAAQLLYEKAILGAKERYGNPIPGNVLSRIRHEMAIISEKNFCAYFLVVQNIVKRASRVCGRGSGAASIVAYCLGITNVCPVKHNLYFERFLNPDRKDPPDIDIDFSWDERDAILDWVLTEFKGHAAMVSNHVLFQPKMAVREVARVFGLPDAEISKISKRLPWFWKVDQARQDLLKQIKERPEFGHMDFPQPWPQIMAYARAIAGTPRYMSVHPGGVVITPDPIDTYVPVEKAPKGVPLIQWEKDAAEEAGLGKIDLLGNRSLGVIRDAVASIKSSRGSFDDFKKMDPEDDYETQQAIAQGNTMGCFYIESPATRLLQKKSRVGDFEHVVIHSSIIRPAANEFIQEYLKRLHTGIWKPIHPLIADVLDETYGIMVYQEDVSKVAVRMAGFSHAKADGLRKIISKKDKGHELADFHEQFRKGALARGVSDPDIKRVWAMITSFSGYSFCKPHSASYARISFQAAYLKTHYPAEFMAAVISNQGGFYSTFAYVSEARRMNVQILHPDVNRSDISWQGKAHRLQVGFLSIKNLSARTMKTIIKERGKTFFNSFEDFLDRVRPGEDEAVSLIHSGSVDGLDKNRNRTGLLWVLAAWKKQRKKKEQTPSLFNVPAPAVPIPELPCEDMMTRLKREFSTLGFLCSCHPMILYQDFLQHDNTVKAKHLPRFPGKKIAFAGWLITGKTVRTKKGDPMKFLTFEDETGIVETVFFPKPYARFCYMLSYGRPYILKGQVDVNWGAVTLTVDSARPVADMMSPSDFLN